MRIGVAGPLSLDLLQDFLPEEAHLPHGYPCPITALYARALLEAGHEVIVYSLCSRILEPYWLEGTPLSVFVAPGRSGWIRMMKGEIELLSQAMRAHAPDVIHAHWPYEFAKAALDSGRPVLVTAHDAPITVIRIMLGSRAVLVRIARLLLAIDVMRRARCLTAVAPYVADEITRWLRPRVPFTIVPNGISQSLFLDELPPRSYPGLTCMAVLSGGFYGLKNGPGLVRAFAWAARKMPGARLVVYGNGCEATGKAAAWAHRAFPHLSLEFRGAARHDCIIQALREECDILLHPSRTESFGMVLLEAMAQGLPVVGGIRSGSVPWLLEDGLAGRLADITSPADFGKAILELLERPVLRRALGQRGQERARRHFTLEAMTKTYLELLEGIRARSANGKLP